VSLGFLVYTCWERKRKKKKESLSSYDKVIVEGLATLLFMGEVASGDVGRQGTGAIGISASLSWGAFIGRHDGVEQSICFCVFRRERERERERVERRGERKK
jgi:hypothetical protein